MEAPSSHLSARGAPRRLLSDRRSSSSAGTECDTGRDMKTHFRVCRFIMEIGNTYYTTINEYCCKWVQICRFLVYFFSFLWNNVTCNYLHLKRQSKPGCTFFIKMTMLCSQNWSRYRLLGLNPPKTMQRNLLCFLQPRCEAGDAFSACGHSLCSVSSFLRTSQLGRVRTVPGGHELCVPSRQSGGAAH